MDSGKVALVTGAAAGIGRAICLRLARDGVAIGALDLNGEGAERTAAEVRAAGGRAIGLAADVSDRSRVQAAVDRLRRELGPVLIVVNNAGMTGFVPFMELTEDTWDRMLAVNLRSAFTVTQVVMPDMLAAKWGRIIMISSSSAQSGAANMAHYSASKGGMIALTRTLAQEFGEHGITANTIPPRFVHNTEMSLASFERPEMQAKFQAMIDAGPIRRHGEPEDIAGAAAWLASDEAGYVTGQVIGVNGGRYI
ncbi:MAG: SDR family oxidoreductase [Sphingomonadales bacterium]|nr:SDR family oxidoreductase [Sphingomonadales bacterium]